MMILSRAEATPLSPDWITFPSFTSLAFGDPTSGLGCTDPVKDDLVGKVLSEPQCASWPPQPGGADLAVVGTFDYVGLASAITGGVYIADDGSLLTTEVLMVSEAVRVEDNHWAYRWRITNYGTGPMTDYFDGPREGPVFGALAPGATLVDTRYPLRLSDGIFTSLPAVGAWGGLWKPDIGVYMPDPARPDGAGLAPPRLHPTGWLDFDPVAPPFGGFGGLIGDRIILRDGRIVVTPVPATGLLALTAALVLLRLGRSRRPRVGN
ncbi:hypothetical protein [Pseudooceanicola sp. LIPI14-2-Ac024]|uniref:hypothetical protein n=1 Tax=Pseudooceanicola sp. LIPI14-2-Ac024 TaxID=3344875 RepID=UPI0035CF51D7